MANRDEFELRVVESMECLTARQLARQGPTMRRRAAPTRAEALEALRAAKGAASVIERIPMLRHPDIWGDPSYWDIAETKGAARGGVFLWDCDFPGNIWNTLDGYANRIAYFAGAENLGGIIPPNKLTGQVWCYLEVPVDAYYTFVAQVQTYPDQYYGPDYVAVIECRIDDLSFGTRTLIPGHGYNLPFVVVLSPGHHRFEIRQVSGAFFFESLTAWAVVPQPVPEAIG